MDSVIINKFEFALTELLLLIIDMKLKEKFRIMSKILPVDASSLYTY